MLCHFFLLLANQRIEFCICYVWSVLGENSFWCSNLNGCTHSLVYLQKQVDKTSDLFRCSLSFPAVLCQPVSVWNFGQRLQSWTIRVLWETARGMFQASNSGPPYSPLCHSWSHCSLRNWPIRVCFLLMHHNTGSRDWLWWIWLRQRLKGVQASTCCLECDKCAPKRHCKNGWQGVGIPVQLFLQIMVV